MKYLIILLLAFCGMFHSAYGRGISEEQAVAKKAHDCIKVDIPKCTSASRLCHELSTTVNFIHDLDCLNQWKDCISEIFEGCQLSLE